LTSKKRLALLLGISSSELQLLVDTHSLSYKHWELEQRERDKLIGLPIKRKPRKIQQPKTALDAIHKRLAKLLGRIEKPSFVYSATKGRSYVENALAHQSDDACIKVDIKDFYSNVSFKCVKKFFLNEMQCVGDVGHVLAVLCCVNGALPTGSAVSPVLSYFACSPMFKSIEKLALSRNLCFTLYVDDMVFSGNLADRSFAVNIRQLLKDNGFIGHKVVHYRAGSTKVITGVAVNGHWRGLPFSRQCKIRMAEDAFTKSTDEKAMRALGSTLIGQYREAERIAPGIKEKARPIQLKLNGLGPSVGPLPKRKKAKKLKSGSSVFQSLRNQRLTQLASRAAKKPVAPITPLETEAA
jgi:hypothetical protein